ncbi:MAG: hypothetical protein ABR507_01305 [Actinomycetota bacterium]
MDKARQAAEQAKTQAKMAADQAKTAGRTAVDQAKAQNPHAADDLKTQLSHAGKWGKASLSTLVERIDPGILADLIIKATAAQEKANNALKIKGSVYRIAEITITATIPPQIGFSVARIGDTEDELTGREIDSADLVASGVTDTSSPTVSLDADGVGPAEELEEM